MRDRTSIRVENLRVMSKITVSFPSDLEFDSFVDSLARCNDPLLRRYAERIRLAQRRAGRPDRGKGSAPLS